MTQTKLPKVTATPTVDHAGAGHMPPFSKRAAHIWPATVREQPASWPTTPRATDVPERVIAAAARAPIATPTRPSRVVGAKAWTSAAVTWPEA